MLSDEGEGICLRWEWTMQSERSVTYRRVLVPIDFSRQSTLALQRALEVAPGWDHLEVLHVVLAPPMPPRSTKRREIRSLDHDDRTGRLEDLVKTVVGDRAAEALLSVEFGTPADRIVERSPRFDLIVMGASGRSGPARLFLGSVAERVVRGAACSVLVARDYEAREDQ